MKSRIADTLDRIATWLTDKVREIARQEIAAHENWKTRIRADEQRELDLDRALRYTEFPPACYGAGEWQVDVDYVNRLRAKVDLPPVDAAELQTALDRQLAL